MTKKSWKDDGSQQFSVSRECSFPQSYNTPLRPIQSNGHDKLRCLVSNPDFLVKTTTIALSKAMQYLATDKKIF